MHEQSTGAPTDASAQQLRAALVGWADVVYLQAKRLWDATAHFFSTVEQEHFRAVHAERGSPDGWDDILAEMTPTLSERDRTRLHADKYFLLLAAAQVVKCADPPDDELPRLRMPPS